MQGFCRSNYVQFKIVLNMSDSTKLSLFAEEKLDHYFSGCMTGFLMPLWYLDFTF